MEVTVERQDGVLLVRVDGRIVGSNAGAFDSAVSAAIGDVRCDVLMDLETISYIGTAGLRTFARVARNLRGAAATLAICAVPDQTRRVFEITGFDRVIPIYPTRAEALSFLARMRHACARGGGAPTGVAATRLCETGL